MTKDSYGYPTKIPTKITDLYGGDNIPTIDDIPTSDDIVEEIEEYLDVDLATEGQVLTMGADGIVEWDDVASGGYSYSSDEKDSGLRWLDNKIIYSKTIEIEHTTSTTIHIWDCPYAINIKKIEGYHTNTSAGSDYKTLSLGYYNSSYYSGIRCNSNNEIIMSLGSNLANTSWKTIVTIYYTKE